MPPNQWNSHESKAQVKMFLKIFNKIHIYFEFVSLKYSKTAACNTCMKGCRNRLLFSHCKNSTCYKKKIVKIPLQTFWNHFFFQNWSALPTAGQRSITDNITTSIVSVDFTPYFMYSINLICVRVCVCVIEKYSKKYRF